MINMMRHDEWVKLRDKREKDARSSMEDFEEESKIMEKK